MSTLDETVGNLQVGVVGGGSMGGGLALLFAEHASRVGLYDYSKDAVSAVLTNAEKDSKVDESLLHGFTSLPKLISAFENPGSRILVLSLPHGKPVDGILDDLIKILDKGDIVIDAGNEWWEETEKRQKRAAEHGIEWIGMGVSGGYQAARHGPSMSPGCTEAAWSRVKPFLEKWCAHTPQGEPCVAHMGPGGAGHYVKMIHNGIEHAHLSILAEVRGLLAYCLGFDNEDIASLFESWVTSPSDPLRGNFLLDIGYKALRFKKGDGVENERGIVEGIEDKVTQDVDLSEGTGTWSTREIAQRHIAAPAIAASHQLRVISANRDERLKVIESFKVPQPRKIETNRTDELVKDIHDAVYAGILGSFIQGLNMITRASIDQKWNVSLKNCLLIWRAGCIIQSDGITDILLPLVSSFPPSKPTNLLASIPELSHELAQTYSALKRVYTLAVEADAVAPAVGSTLEWMKSIGGKDLPTNFEEMELDYFGHHNYDIKGELEAGHEKGKYHTEFQST